MDLEYLKASDGTGEAVLAHITSPRSPGSSVLEVDNLENWNDKFIVVTGTVAANGYINPAGMTIMYGHEDAGDIAIDGFAPGYADNGNTTAEVAIVKMTTNYADALIDLLQVVHKDNGQLKKDAPVENGLTLLNLAPRGAILEYAAFTAPEGWLMCDGAAVDRDDYADLFALLNPVVGDFTVTIASPGVVTLNAHGLLTSDPVYLTTTGALPTGLSANTRYWVIKVNDNTFRLATSQANADAGTAINTSGTQSGTHTLRRSPYGVGDGSTTFNVPDRRGRVGVGVDASQTEFNTLGKNVGAKTHTLSEAEMPAHVHNTRAFSSAGGSSQRLQLFVGSGGTVQTIPGGDSTGVQTTGGSAAHNNVQPSQGSNFIIKA